MQHLQLCSTCNYAAPAIMQHLQLCSIFVKILYTVLNNLLKSKNNTALWQTVWGFNQAEKIMCLQEILRPFCLYLVLYYQKRNFLVY